MPNIAEIAEVVPPGLNEERAALYLDVSPSSFRRGVKMGELPQPVQISERRNIWLISELNEVIAARAAARPPSEWRAKLPKPFDPAKRAPSPIKRPRGRPRKVCD